MAGYTNARRTVVTLPDGRTAFRKEATDAQTAEWLRAERRVCSSLAGAPFLATVFDWEDGDYPALILEDLSACRWPPPWLPGDVSRVRDTLGVVAACSPPPGLPTSEAVRQLDGWPTVAASPTAFLSLGVCSEGWLDLAMPVLARASSRAPVDGTALQHLDVRSDNLCFREDGSVVLIDWNLACTAAPHVDLVTWLPSLEAEGGPAPEAVVGDGGGFAGEAALVAGFFAARAGLPVIPHAPLVRQVQLAQLRSALPWAARANGLPPPEPPLV